MKFKPWEEIAKKIVKELNHKKRKDFHTRIETHLANMGEGKRYYHVSEVNFLLKKSTFCGITQQDVKAIVKEALAAIEQKLSTLLVGDRLNLDYIGTFYRRHYHKGVRAVPRLSIKANQRLKVSFQQNDIDYTDHESYHTGETSEVPAHRVPTAGERRE